MISVNELLSSVEVKARLIARLSGSIGGIKGQMIEAHCNALLDDIAAFKATTDTKTTTETKK